MTRRFRAVAAAAIVAGIFVACSVGNVDFANKACPCGTGFVCDTSRDLCVLPSELVQDAAPDVAAADAPVESGGDAGCVGDTCPCAGDGDCKDKTLPHCAPNKTCVQCIAPTDCGSGTYCNAQNECVLGCKQESDCQISPAAPHCDLGRHQCVACRTMSDCTTPGDMCSPSGQCVPGCNVDAGILCAGGKTCCGGLCIDTTKDNLNCGGCGIACSTANATPTCSASACTFACAAGFAHCGTGNTGCEVNTRTDATNCGSCTTNCNTLVANATGIACNVGACDYGACDANFDDCDGIRTNGCECTCGTKKMERCCPGGTCNAPLTCLPGPMKCN